MRKKFSLALAVLTTVSLSTAGAFAGQEKDSPNPPPGVKLENLLKAQLEGVEGAEIIVSRVTVPPNTSLPKHWHPGEEFGYILEGSAILWQEGKDDQVVKAGEILKVPLKQVHTAVTKDEGAVILVFRVHEPGKPERILVDQSDP